MPRIIDITDKIRDAEKVHGYKYDYSKVEYTNAKTKLCIICSEHGEFYQTLHNHLYGKGCPICGKDKIWITRNRVTTEDFIKKAKMVHGDKYDYSKVDYINAKTKVCIICNEIGKNGKVHGEFYQTPSNHLNKKKYGCPKCGHHISSSEEKLYLYIKDKLKDVDLYRQYTPDFLQNGVSHMSIDIFIPEYNIGIEYQGEQHFKPVKYFGGEEKYLLNLKRDKLKYELCSNNGIKLFYFSYEKELIPNDYFTNVFTDEKELLNNIKNYIND